MVKAKNKRFLEKLRFCIFKFQQVNVLIYIWKYLILFAASRKIL